MGLSLVYESSDAFIFVEDVTLFSGKTVSKCSRMLKEESICKKS